SGYVLENQPSRCRYRCNVCQAASRWLVNASSFESSSSRDCSTRASSSIGLPWTFSQRCGSMRVKSSPATGAQAHQRLYEMSRSRWSEAGSRGTTVKCLRVGIASPSAREDDAVFQAAEALDFEGDDIPCLQPKVARHFRAVQLEEAPRAACPAPNDVS